MHYGRLVVANVMVLLVVALSTATRRPCLQAPGGSWHTYKTGHMAESEQHEISVTQASETAKDVAATTEDSAPRYFFLEESLPTAFPLIAQTRHFRSPPFLQ